MARKIGRLTDCGRLLHGSTASAYSTELDLDNDQVLIVVLSTAVATV